MTLLTRIACFFSMPLVFAFCQPMPAQEVVSKDPVKTAPQFSADKKLSTEEISALLDAIDLYLPEAKAATGEIDIFGSTSMDGLAHSWGRGFKKFHKESTFIISAEGSETVVDRLSKNPSSIGMLSRPISTDDLTKLKAAGLKQPVAIQVAREPLGVFVHASNPLEVITYPQLVSLFCAKDSGAEVNWDAVGVAGELSQKPIHIVGRDKKSGTRKFVETYLFHLHAVRKSESEMSSNAEVVRAVGKDPQAIAISDYKYSNKSVRRLKLRNNGTVIEGDEHEILLGHYPITRPLTLIFDLDAQSKRSAANREFAKYALSQSGQVNAILAGFYPFDPPTLRGEMSKLKVEKASKQ